MQVLIWSLFVSACAGLAGLDDLEIVDRDAGAETTSGGQAGIATGGAGANTGGSAGSLMGGAAGTGQGGTAGYPKGGAGGSATGGAGGSATGGSAGHPTGGVGGSATGGSAGCMGCAADHFCANGVCGCSKTWDCIPNPSCAECTIVCRQAGYCQAQARYHLGSCENGAGYCGDDETWIARPHTYMEPDKCGPPSFCDSAMCGCYQM